MSVSVKGWRTPAGDGVCSAVARSAGVGQASGEETAGAQARCWASGDLWGFDVVEAPGVSGVLVGSMTI
jgi:hypothetical protein